MAVEPPTPTGTNLYSQVPKEVRFGETITIIEFPYSIGDNPAVSSGCPIGLGRKHQRKDVRNFEMYEYCRSDERRKESKHLKLPVDKRAQLLLRSGYQIDAIANATLQADKIKEERLETLKKQGWDNVAQFVVESGKIPRGIMKAALTTTGGVGGVVLATGGLLVDAGGSIVNTTVGGLGSVTRSLSKKFVGSTTPKQNTLRAKSA